MWTWSRGKSDLTFLACRSQSKARKGMRKELCHRLEQTKRCQNFLRDYREFAYPILSKNHLIRMPDSSQQLVSHEVYRYFAFLPRHHGHMLQSWQILLKYPERHFLFTLHTRQSATHRTHRICCQMSSECCTQVNKSVTLFLLHKRISRSYLTIRMDQCRVNFQLWKSLLAD